MNKYENDKQKNFEQLIELLITYKKLNPSKVVYLNEKCINKALAWYNDFSNNIKI